MQKIFQASWKGREGIEIFAIISFLIVSTVELLVVLNYIKIDVNG